jgi:hypothetical protein
MLVGDSNTVVMLFSTSTFEGFTQNTIPAAGTEVLLSIDVQSRDDLDAVTQRARAAGAEIFAEPAEVMGWMYGSGFVDPDGHRWNLLFMDMSKMPQQ